MTNRARISSPQAGYSLIEMIFVMGLMVTLSAMAILQINTSSPGLKGDGAMRVVLAQLNQARESAITQRRYVRVVFTSPNLVQQIREDSTSTTTVLSSVLLEGGAAFTLITGLPDSPDHFGNSTAIAFGAVTNVKFAPDGTLVNQDGATANGTAFLALPNRALSARAITILGSTGRIRGYRWVGAQWNLV